jgi:uncharacterized protein YlxW (UPF0749 family)
MPDRTPPPQVTMGLLDYLSTHTYDEDYETVAERRSCLGESHGQEAPSRAWSRGAVGALVLAAFGLLLVVAGTQTSREALALSDERKDLISQINDQTAALHRDQQRVQALQAGNRHSAQEGQVEEARYLQLRAQVRRLSVLAGTSRVHGPGVAVVVDDAPNAGANDRAKVLDSDLQRLVNGLWQAGAEAIAINGQRLTSLSSIRKAGSAITVNYHSLDRPYRVLAIGDPDTLPARFAETDGGQAWFDLHQQVGLRFAIHTRQALELPRATPDLHYARPIHEGGGAS